MKMMVFDWHGQEALVDRLTKGFFRMSVETAAHHRPISVTLWRKDGTGISVQSQMHDVAEWREVGVLRFSEVTSEFAKEDPYKLPLSFDGNLKVTKLLITESGVVAESGVLLEASDGQSLVIVAGAYPYSLAIEGGPKMAHGFEPEYPLEDYTRVT